METAMPTDLKTKSAFFQKKNVILKNTKSLRPFQSSHVHQIILFPTLLLSILKVTLKNILNTFNDLMST